MSDCKKCQALFADALYEELNAEQRHFFKDHIQVCEKCKSEFAEMTSTLRIMNKRIRPEPGQAFWDNYENKLAKRMQEEKTLEAKSESRWRRFIRTLNLAPKWAYQTTAALLLIILGIYIGRMMYSPSASEIQQARQLAGFVSQPEPGIELISRTQNYIEHSKLILLTMTNFDPETEDPYALNLPYQQQVSRELVHEASFLKKELADSDQRRLQNLITDLEVILLQIANLESEHDLEAVELFREGVNIQGILLRIHFTDVRQTIKRGYKTIPAAKAQNKL